MILEALGVLGVLVELYFVLWLMGQCPTTTAPPKGDINGKNNNKNCGTVYLWDSDSNEDGMVLHTVYVDY